MVPDLLGNVKLFSGLLTMNKVEAALLEQQLIDAAHIDDMFAICRNHGLSEVTTNEVIAHFSNTHPKEQHTMKTTITFDSPILANSFSFEAAKLGRSYLKAKQAALKARGDQQTELIQKAKIARAAWTVISGFIPPEFSYDEIVTEFCGLGREWNASGKMVAQFAEANGVDQQLAADLVARQMTVAQDYAQATRGINFGRYLSWLQDAADEHDDDTIPANIEEIILGAYNRAAQWNQPADGLMIRDFAENMGVSEILPTWADCLKANMPSAESALEARRRMSNRAAAAASAEAEAEQDLTLTHGTF